MNLVFIKKDDKYYYKYGDRVYELNDATFESLKNKIYMPLTIRFRGCPIMFISNVTQTLFDKTVDVDVRRIDIDKNPEVYDYEATITEVMGKTF